ncbi:MAG: DUF6600 domain-containing protein [Spartobacteria bacterium]
MKRILLLPLIATLAVGLGSCQKQSSDTERQAEIERQVQERLAAERQANDQQQMAQRQTDLEARIETLAAERRSPAATANPERAQSPVAEKAAATPGAEQGSYSTFYRKLDPYGDWMETGDYGYVFQPHQATQSRDWRPYTQGHWVYTDAGWTWISDEKFGWATYHYGRWVQLRSVGWVWVPGDQWAPAWVSWRKGGDYVGWAPLPPEAQFDRQTGIRSWADNYYDIGPDQYAFVRANEFGSKLTLRAIVPTVRNVTIINQTTNVTNIVYNNSVIVDRGPSYEDLRARSQQPIERFRLERTSYQNSEVPVFRGEVVALPTADFNRGERVARPNRVVRTIEQPVVERGWAGIKDTQAAQKARAKMESESTPPPNPPPKRFVRPGQKTAVPPRPAPVRVGQPVSSPAPAISMTPMGTPVPAPTAAPRVPRVTPAPTVKPSATPVAESVQPTENVYSPKKADRNRTEAARLAQEEKQKERQAAQEQRQAARKKQLQDRRGQKPGREKTSPTATASPKSTATAIPSATATATATASEPSTTPTPSPTASAGKKEDAEERRKAKRAERRAQRNQDALETPPSPQPQQP